MAEGASFAMWIRERQQRIETFLERRLPVAQGPAARLHEAVRYAALGGGKRLRPLLAYAAGELVHAAAESVDAPAAAVELIHAYSLVHDDLPCMDDDVLRRGKPTAHVAYGEATALLAGDALQAMAFQVLGESAAYDSGGACALLAAAAGAHGMAGGQQIDLAATGTVIDVPGLEQMHRMKTGALIAVAVQLGARASGPLRPEHAEALAHYASASGLAFQVVDDVLDVEASSADLGKTAGKDAAQGKPTYVSLLGVDAARRHAEALREQALVALEAFGDDAQRLRDLADYIVLRRH